MPEECLLLKDVRLGKSGNCCKAVLGYSNKLAKELDRNVILLHSPAARPSGGGQQIEKANQGKEESQQEASWHQEEHRYDSCNYLKIAFEYSN